MAIVDKIRTTYQELFSVALEHPAYETDFIYRDPVSSLDKTITSSTIFTAMSVEADADTKKIFTRYSMDYRCINNMIVCFVRTNMSEPYIKFPSDIRLRFMLKFKTEFLYRTRIAATGSEQVYFFSNTNTTLDAGIKHITKNSSGVADADIENNSAVIPASVCSAVIEILASVTDSNYRLLNGDLLASPAFVIRFIKK